MVFVGDAYVRTVVSFEEVQKKGNISVDFWTSTCNINASRRAHTNPILQNSYTQATFEEPWIELKLSLISNIIYVPDAGTGNLSSDLNLKAMVLKIRDRY